MMNDGEMGKTDKDGEGEMGTFESYCSVDYDRDRDTVEQILREIEIHGERETGSYSEKERQSLLTNGVLTEALVGLWMESTREPGEASRALRPPGALSYSFRKDRREEESKWKGGEKCTPVLASKGRPEEGVGVKMKEESQGPKAAAGSTRRAKPRKEYQEGGWKGEKSSSKGQRESGEQEPSRWEFLERLRCCEREGKGGSEEEEAEMARMRWGIRRWKKGGGEV